MKSLTPFVLLLLAGILYYFAVDPQFADVQEIRAEHNEYQFALESLRQAEMKKIDLINQLKSFPLEDRRKLDVMIPSRLDDPHLALEIAFIAGQSDVVLNSINLTAEDNKNSKNKNNAPEVQDETTLKLRTKQVGINIQGTYEEMQTFIRNLEASLHIYEITQVSFSGRGDSGNSYTINAETYWLP